MLKWLGGGGGNGSNNGLDNLTHVGKVFSVNEHQVVVEELVAEGGFAVVYRTRSPRGQVYALKRMAVNNEQDLYLAKQEIAITRALSDCPNSVTYISSSVRMISSEVHEVLILMQLYSGPSVVDLLNSRLAKKTVLSEREVLKIFSDVVVAVGRLHHRTKPIIHRDLKIENILSDSHGTYILCDYGSCTVHSMHPETLGAAKCEDEIGRFTTLAYRAPEMVSLYSGKTITAKADIWALGCVLYKLCFMSTPFGEQPLAIVSAQFTFPQDNSFSDELHSLICYMLEPDPDLRPAIWQVNEVVCRMQGLPNTLPNVFRSPKPPASLPRTNRRENTRKTISPSSEATDRSPQSTPASLKPRVAASVTTTSISSRQRPKARGTASTPSVKTASPTTSTSTSIPLVTRVHSNSPPSMRAHSRLEMPTADRVERLQLGGQQADKNQSKSWDTGLDMFGAVPFSSPAEQVLPTQLFPKSSNFVDVRSDLFGSTPFTFPPPPPPIAQQTTLLRPSSSTPAVDDFGAQPFVTCS